MGVCLPARNAELWLHKCLGPMLRSSLKPRILVIDSSSTDRTVEVAKSLGVETVTIPQREFNHGSTRELGRKLLGTDIVVMITHDAIAQSDSTLEILVKPIMEGRAVAAYGRQLPREGADIFEAFPQEFNYPAESQFRTFEDRHKYGIFTFFFSDNLGAYLNSAVEAIGGFQPVLTNEDYFAAAKLMQAGGTVAYVAEAVIRHSHDFSLLQQFRRYFDTGYVRAEQPWVSQLVGAAEGRGLGLTMKLFRRLFREQPWMLPYAFLQTAVKWAGYRSGFIFFKAPLGWKRNLSAQRYYWDSVHAPAR